MYIDFLETPLGTMEIRASRQGITKVIFSTAADKTIFRNTLTETCKQQLQAYFTGKRKTFDLPLDQQGTSFQKSVWAALVKIPYGQTASYQTIATMIDNPKAVRAVGAANGRNPISIIVPCHRIIGSNGTLTGYAGGLDRKAWLLEHEKKQRT